MANPEHKRRFRGKKRRRAIAAARFERQAPVERTAARDLAVPRRVDDEDVLGEALMRPAAHRYSWPAP